MTARERIAEFLRQWAKMRDKGDHIYGVGLEPYGDPVILRASDLRNVLAELAAAEAAVRWHEGRATKGVEYVALTAALHAEIRALSEGDHHD